MQQRGFSGRDFLTLMDFTAEEIQVFLSVAAELKARLRKGEPHEVLRGRTAMLLFEKLSTRTRVSFQVACAHLGMQSFYAMPEQLQMKRGEPIKDTARVIDRYCNVVFMRTYGQDRIEEFAACMANPVINALTDLAHPCQGLADLLTIQEHKGRLEGIRLAYAGDVWNVCHTLVVAGSLMGMEVVVARPPGYELAPRIKAFVEQRLGAAPVVTESLKEAVRGADVVYANTWHSMGGPEAEKDKRLSDFAPYQVNRSVMDLAKEDAVFMHCLPGYRGEEMTDEVIEGPQSVVFDQAENRLHTAKAVLYLILGGTG